MATNADPPPEVLAALNLPTSEEPPTQAETEPAESPQVDDDAYYRRKWNDGWLSDPSK